MEPEALMPCTRRPAVLLLALATLGTLAARADDAPGLRGDAEAIAEAGRMVEAMGGRAIWGALRSVHFVHEWDLWNRPDRYLEHEILDLTGPRSYVTMKSEIYERIRAYSPEHRYWNVVDGEFSYASDEALANALERAPYSLYRLAAAVARGEADFTLRFGEIPSLPGVRALEFVGPDGAPHGWVALNARAEPIVWATTQYTYELGPLERFGNLRVPDWGVTGGGKVRYRMVSLEGDDEPPALSLFAPPAAEADD